MISKIKPQKVQSKLIHKEKISSRVYMLTFEHIAPIELQFLPGHFLNMQVSPTAFRSYSISSDYKDTKTLSLIIAAEHDGVGASYIRNLAVGDIVFFIGPSGRFLLPDTLDQNLVFLATGTGISPFITFLYRFADTGYSGKIKLYFGVRDDSELFFNGLLEDFKSKLPNFDYEICYSSLDNRVTNHIQTNVDASAQYFLCGNPSMIDDSIGLLELNGVLPENIFYEKFTHTGSGSK